MKDVFETVYVDAPTEAQARLDKLSQEERDRRLTVEQFITAVRTEARARYAGLPRDSRRTKISEAVRLARHRAGLDRGPL
jgi:hypothetical protein